jgi:hypothetical protein
MRQLNRSSVSLEKLKCSETEMYCSSALVKYWSALKPPGNDIRCYFQVVRVRNHFNILDVLNQCNMSNERFLIFEQLYVYIFFTISSGSEQCGLSVFLHSKSLDNPLNIQQFYWKCVIISHTYPRMTVDIYILISYTYLESEKIIRVPNYSYGTITL